MVRHSCPPVGHPALFFCALLGAVLVSAEVRAECPGSGGVPNSDIPCGITLVGTTGGIADPLGQFTIVLRDLAFNPAPNCEVMIDFGACDPDIRISLTQPHPGLRVECDANGARVYGTTDANGVLNARIVGAATPGATAAGFKCASVYGGGQILGTINVAACDLDGSGGANPADISRFLVDLFDGDFEGRTDYNCSNTISPTDLSLLLQLSFGAGSVNSGGNYCQ